MCIFLQSLNDFVFFVEDMLEEIKFHAEASKSRNSKRGTLTQATKIKLDGGSNKSKSPAIGASSKYVADENLSSSSHTQKDKLMLAELAVAKSIYMRTAQFLIKHNAFAVI